MVRIKGIGCWWDGEGVQPASGPLLALIMGDNTLLGCTSTSLHLSTAPDHTLLYTHLSNFIVNLRLSLCVHIGKETHGWQWGGGALTGHNVYYRVCSRALGTHWAQCLLVLVQLHWTPTTGHNGWKLELLIRGRTRILVYYIAYYNTTDHPRYNVAPQCIAACEHSVTVHTMAPN